MQIESMNIQELSIPFNMQFQHSSADRRETQAVIVKTTTSNRTEGYGEGCPREYVTQESIASTMAFFSVHKDTLVQNIHTLNDLQEFVYNNQKCIDENPAAWCAMELSLLEALAKEQHYSVEELLGLDELEGCFKYSAILGEGSLQSIAAQVQAYKQYGFSDFKVKISGDTQKDTQKFTLIQEAIEGVRIRLDANNYYKTADEVLAYLEAINITPFAIEEPLQARDYPEMSKLIKATDIPIIYDESCCNEKDLAKLPSTQSIVNLRISKMGGLLRSLEIAKKSQEKNIPLIIGAQVGESSILTRAALSIANSFKSSVIAQEGAFGVILLAHDVTKKPWRFSKGGQLSVEHYDNNAHGFQIDYAL